MGRRRHFFWGGGVGWLLCWAVARAVAMLKAAREVPPGCARDGVELESGRGELRRMQLSRREPFLEVFRGVA